MPSFQVPNHGTFYYTELPNTCPYCHKEIIAIVNSGIFIGSRLELELYLTCPNKECSKSFIGYYTTSKPSSGMASTAKFTNRTSVGEIKKREFDGIESISPILLKYIIKLFLLKNTIFLKSVELDIGSLLNS